MAMSTVCQTPGAQFHTHITGESLNVTVDFGRNLGLNEEQATLLGANVHNVLEMLLAQYYVPEPAHRPIKPEH